MNLGSMAPLAPLGYPYGSGNRRDKEALRTTCIKNVKFKIKKTRTGCQYVGYFYHSENLNWASENPRLGIADLKCIKINANSVNTCTGPS